MHVPNPSDNQRREKEKELRRSSLKINMVPKDKGKVIARVKRKD